LENRGVPLLFQKLEKIVKASLVFFLSLLCKREKFEYKIETQKKQSDTSQLRINKVMFWLLLFIIDYKVV